MRRSSGTQSLIRSSPPVTPASAMNDAISMWSGETRCSQPPSRASPWTCMTFEPMPSIAAPMRISMPREVLHVRLGGGVADHRRAGRQRGRHQRVLRAHHGRLVHEEVARLEAAVGRAQADVAVVLDARAERAEGVEVRVEPAAADHVAAGRRQQRLAEAGEQRAGDEERRADPLGQRRGRPPSCVTSSACSATVLPSRRSTVTPRSSSSAEHRLRVADPRHVVEHDLLVRQQAGGQQRQGRVLVAGGHDGAGQRHAAFDDELLHERWERRGGTDVGPARKLG